MGGPKERLTEYRAWAKAELERCVAFWLENGMDRRHGGILTCLDREGQVYSTDKSVWMQGRCAWMFSYLCRVYGSRPEWLEAARSCLDFLEAHCINRSAGNRMYFTVTWEGRPLRQRRYCFSEAFYAMACAEYGALTGDKVFLRRAQEAADLIWGLIHGLIRDPTGLTAKTIPQTRTTRGLANPMIYLNLCSILRRCDPDNRAVYGERAQASAQEILRYHVKPEMNCTLETVGLDGAFLGEVTEGRVVNPGHDMECSWFLMEEANYRKDPALAQTARMMYANALRAGWDEEYGGLLYFVDCLGKPPESYEHDMKLWWPHNELMIASLAAYRDTGEQTYLDDFDRTLRYCREHFSDPEYGEWYGYLRRDGKPTMPPSKGSTFKGPFHLPRMLCLVEQIAGELLQKA